MSTRLVWQDPPAGNSRTRWPNTFAELRRHPGRWALVATKSTRPAANSTATAIRRGRLNGAEPGEFEVCCDGLKIYARYPERTP